jgi:hypothetical protein
MGDLARRRFRLPPSPSEHPDARALAQRRTTPAGIVRAAAVPFLAFVLGLGIVVGAVTGNGLAAALGHLVPGGTGLPALLAIVALAAVLANIVNNLPAVLVLLPLTAPSGPGAVLAVLLGTNIGPTSPTPGPWPPCCGGASCANTTQRLPSGSSPALACSPCPPPWCLRRWHCGPR